MTNAPVRAFWCEGTRSEILVDGETTGGAFALLEELLPAASGPPLHAHPEAETFVVRAGALRLWVFEPDEVPEPIEAWDERMLRRGVLRVTGESVYVPPEHPHCYRVEGASTARVLVVSAPAGLERWTREFGVPAPGPGLPPEGATPDAPRDRVVAFARTVGVRRLGPPAPAG